MESICWATYINGRWYEPAGRRFLSEGGGLSGYRFGNNNPTSRQTVSRYATDSSHGYTESSFASIFWENYTHWSATVKILRQSRRL